MKAHKFFVVGRGELDLNPKPQVIVRVVEFLKGTKYKDLYTLNDLCDHTGYSISHLGSRYATHPDLKGFRFKVGKSVYWGNEKTIQELKEGVNEKTIVDNR